MLGAGLKLAVEGLGEWQDRDGVQEEWSERSDHEVEQTVSEEQTASESVTLHVDSRAITDAYETVFADPEVESIVYLSGLSLDDGVRTVNRVHTFAHAEQSAVRAVGNPEASFDALQELDRTGHELVAHLHNHPGQGVSGAKPSETDLAYQRNLEGLGHVAIGWIATEDGFLRAFSDAVEFDIAVHGETLTTHDRGQHTFRVRDV